MTDDEFKDYIGKWLVKANNDMTIASRDLGNDDPVTDAICFHCQQAAEKYLKAFLIYHKIDTGKTHNLFYLLNQ